MKIEIASKTKRYSDKTSRLLMCSIKELKLNIKQVFNSSIGAITKILNLRNHNFTPLVHLFSTSSTDISLFNTPSLLPFSSSTVLNFTFQPIFFKIDSCWYGSDCVNKRNSCQLKFSPFQPPQCCDAMMHVLKDFINLKYSELLTKEISKSN